MLWTILQRQSLCHEQYSKGNLCARNDISESISVLGMIFLSQSRCYEQYYKGNLCAMNNTPKAISVLGMIFLSQSLCHVQYSKAISVLEMLLQRPSLYYKWCSKDNLCVVLFASLSQRQFLRWEWQCIVNMHMIQWYLWKPIVSFLAANNST